MDIILMSLTKINKITILNDLKKNKVSGISF